MITAEQKTENQIKFIDLLSKLGVDLTEFTKYLNAIDYFNKPFTAQYDYNYEGGLCEYALKLCHELGVLCEAYFPGKYTEEDIIKVALLKDVYRAELYEEYNKNIKNDTTGQWESVKAFKTAEERTAFGDLNFSSFMRVRNFFTFTDEQLEAIIHGNGVANPNNFPSDIYGVLKTFPLATLTKMADLVVNNLL